MPEVYDLTAWDASTFVFTDETSREIVAEEARDLAEQGLRVWVLGPYVMIAGPTLVVQCFDEWVITQLELAREAARSTRPAWAPPMDVD